MCQQRVSSKRVSFKTGMVSLDAVWKTYCRLNYLSGCPTTMSGLTTVTDVSVSMVTRHGFSRIQPSVIRLSSVPLASTFVTFKIFLAGTYSTFELNCSTITVMLPPSWIPLILTPAVMQWTVLFTVGSWFSWTLLTAYFKAELKSNGDNVSPCFRRWRIENSPDRILPIWTLL
jgi:hypothetical protein